MGNVKRYLGDIDRALGNEGKFSRAEWRNSMKEVRGLCSQRKEHVQRHTGTCTIIPRWLGRSMSFNG